MSKYFNFYGVSPNGSTQPRSEALTCTTLINSMTHKSSADEQSRVRDYIEASGIEVAHERLDELRNNALACKAAEYHETLAASANLAACEEQRRLKEGSVHMGLIGSALLLVSAVVMTYAEFVLTWTTLPALLGVRGVQAFVLCASVTASLAILDYVFHELLDGPWERRHALHWSVRVMLALARSALLLGLLAATGYVVYLIAGQREIALQVLRLLSSSTAEAVPSSEDSGSLGNFVRVFTVYVTLASAILWSAGRRNLWNVLQRLKASALLKKYSKDLNESRQRAEAAGHAADAAQHRLSENGAQLAEAAKQRFVAEMEAKLERAIQKPMKATLDERVNELLEEAACAPASRNDHPRLSGVFGRGASNPN